MDMDIILEGMPSLFFSADSLDTKGVIIILVSTLVYQKTPYVCVQRLEFLAALEMAFQEQLPIGLQLAHVDRDFNE